MQLWAHCSRYRSSSFVPTASAALRHISLGSWQPASLQSFDTERQISSTSFGSSIALLVRTSRHTSLAKTHVLTYLTLSNTSSLSFFRLISKLFFLAWQKRSMPTDTCVGVHLKLIAKERQFTDRLSRSRKATGNRPGYICLILQFKTENHQRRILCWRAARHSTKISCSSLCALLPELVRKNRR